jgi:hypothetical protein
VCFGAIRGNKKAAQRLPYRTYRLTGKNLAGKKGRTGNNTRFAVILLPAKILRLFERGRVFNNHKVLLGLAGKICVCICGLSWQQKSRTTASLPYFPPYRQKFSR